LETFNKWGRGIDVHTVNYNTINRLGQRSGVKFLELLEASFSTLGPVACLT